MANGSNSDGGGQSINLRQAAREIEELEMGESTITGDPAAEIRGFGTRFQTRDATSVDPNQVPGNFRQVLVERGFAAESAFEGQQVSQQARQQRQRQQQLQQIRGQVASEREGVTPEEVSLDVEDGRVSGATIRDRPESIQLPTTEGGTADVRSPEQAASLADSGLLPQGSADVARGEFEARTETRTLSFSGDERTVPAIARQASGEGTVQVRTQEQAEALERSGLISGGEAARAGAAIREGVRPRQRQQSRESAVESLLDRAGQGFSREDVVVSDGQVSISKAARRREATEAARGQAALARTDNAPDDVASAFASLTESEQESLASVSPFSTEDVTLSGGGDGPITATISQPAREREFRESAAQRAGREVDPSEISVTRTEEGGLRGAPTIAAQREQAGAESEEFSAQDFAPVAGGGLELTQAAQRREAGEAFEERFAGILAQQQGVERGDPETRTEAGEDFQVIAAEGGGFRAEPTDRLQQRLIGSEFGFGSPEFDATAAPLRGNERRRQPTTTEQAGPPAVGSEDVSPSIPGGEAAAPGGDQPPSIPGGELPEPTVGTETGLVGVPEGAFEEGGTETGLPGVSEGVFETGGTETGLPDTVESDFDPITVFGPGAEDLLGASVADQLGDTTLEEALVGEQGVDTEVTDVLTAGRGLFREGGEGDDGTFLMPTETELRERAQQRREFFGVGEELGGVVGDVTVGLPGSDEAESFATGVGNVPGEAAALPPTALLGADLATEAGANLPGAVEEFGGERVARAGAQVAGATAVGMARDVRADPFEFGGEVAGEFVLGSAAFRGIERGADVARNLRVQSRGPVVDVGETTTPPAARLEELPEFETDPMAPTSEAVEEVRLRAADQPEELTALAGEESLLFRSESEALPAEFEAGRGQFELPGLFASPELSPLRLEGSPSRSMVPSLRPRLPRIRGPDDQVTLFPGERIEGMPETATGAGRVFDPETGGLVPDPETSGARFLEQEADPGTAFVRPPGSRTTELEAIFPPGSAFEEVGEFGVRLESGRIVPGRAFGRGEADVDVDIGDVDGDAIPASDLPETRISRQTRPPGQPAAPPVPTASAFGAGDGSTASNFASGIGESSLFGTPAAGGGVADSLLPGSTDTGGAATGQTISEPAPGMGGVSSPFGTPGAESAPASGGVDTAPDGSVFSSPAGSAPGMTEPVAGGSSSVFGSIGSPAEGSPFGGTPAESAPSSAGPGDPTDLFFGTPAETPAETPTPTGPPTGAPSTPTGIPTGTPFGPSGTPTGTPFTPDTGAPSGAPGTGTPFLPGMPPTDPPGRPPQPEGDAGGDDDDRDRLFPTGQEFQNPIASGVEFLFGREAGDFGTTGAFGDLGGEEQADDIVSLFGGGGGQ